MQIEEGLEMSTDRLLRYFRKRNFALCIDKDRKCIDAKFWRAFVLSSCHVPSSAGFGVLLLCMHSPFTSPSSLLTSMQVK